MNYKCQFKTLQGTQKGKELEVCLNDEHTSAETLNKININKSSIGQGMYLLKGESFLPKNYLDRSYKQKCLMYPAPGYAHEEWRDAAKEAAKTNPLSGVVLELLKTGFFLEEAKHHIEECENNDFSKYEDFWVLVPIEGLIVTEIDDYQKITLI